MLTLLQIVLLPVCIAIAPGPLSKWSFTVVTIMFALRLYLETIHVPNHDSSSQATRAT